MKPESGLHYRTFYPDQVTAGGYCTDACDTYWKKLVESAVYMK